MTIGQTIREIRQAYGLTQKELGERCGIDDATIRKYETGKLNPKPVTLEKIAKGLKIDVSVLTEGELDAPHAMIKLFSIFRACSGALKSGEQIVQEVQNGTFDKDNIYLTFGYLKGLMLTWFWVYDKYCEALKNAEEIKDDDLRGKKKKQIENGFNLWMINYPETDNSNMMHYMKVIDELIKYSELHPLNDPEQPRTKAERKKIEQDQKAILDTLFKV